MTILDETPGRLISRIDEALNEKRSSLCLPGISERQVSGLSVVLFLLGTASQPGGSVEEPCLILNKRSEAVKQPGDLCCPGGGLAPRQDRFLSWLMALPRTPLSRWRHWREWKKNRPDQAAWLRLHLATGLREAFEEMRMNPFSMTFLGPLPKQRLVLFDRTIYPLAGWLSGRKRFALNNEVEKLVYIPIKQLLDRDNYFRYRIEIKAAGQEGGHGHKQDFPGFRHRNAAESELLWGATFRIAMDFLEIVFGFRPPAAERLPVVHGMIGKHYLSGASQRKAN